MSDSKSIPSDEFWRTYLSGAQSTEFPSASRKRNVTGSTTGGTRSSTDVLTIGRGVPDSAIVAAWALVLSVHTLVEDVVFGLSCASTIDSSHSSAGILPFRIVVPESGISTSQLLESVESSLLQIRSHGDETLDQISGLDGSCREACRFSTQLEILSSAKDAETTARRFDEESSVPRCPLIVKCLKSNDSVECYVEFDTAVHTREISHALLDHLNLAIQAITSGSAAIEEVDLFGISDYETVVGTWTQPVEPASTQPLLHTAVEEQARTNPLAVAIGQTDIVMTYGELDKGATLLARHITSLAPKTPEGKIGNVAVLFEKSPFAILSMLAILKAGGAFVPIDIDWPEKRVQMVLSGADIKIVVCSKNQLQRLSSFSVEGIVVDARFVYDLKKRHSSSPRNTYVQEPNILPSDPAYIMFTSGSTGRPKGIEISHRSITTSINAMSREFHVDRSKRALQFSAFTFDVSVGDIWLTLSAGARLCLPTEDERFAIDRFIEAERCDFALLTPSAAATIRPSVAKKHLKSIFLIGEAPSAALLRQIAPLRDDSNILSNTWGPTEACVICTTSQPITVREDGALSQPPRDIGKSLGASMVLVSSRNPNHLSPAYAPGEIALIGHTLATSYYGDKAKTDEAFRTDLAWTRDSRLRELFGDEVLSTVYLTGDIGRFSEEGDGNVIFMHRRGGYIKVNGFRIDPGEVEKAISDLDASMNQGQGETERKTFAVAALERTTQDEQESQTRQTLVCFFAKGSKVNVRGERYQALDMDQSTRSKLVRLAGSLRETVPEYMIPKFFVPVSGMPVSTSSKLDLKSLLALLDQMEWDDVVRKYGVEDVAKENDKKAKTNGGSTV